MRVLVTGNQGYIGTVLVPMLLERGFDVVGFDLGLYEECLLIPDSPRITQISEDIRNIKPADLRGVDAVIHLAGLSNDPLGELSPGLTEDINLSGTLKLAELSKKEGVQRFVFASSQSMYGISSADTELDEDLSEKNPITSYAKSKWDAECNLKKLNDETFTAVFFRPSTVFGASPRLRMDIVFNNLVGCAFTTGSIEIKSDGSPWRPVVHVRDVCEAFISGLIAPKDLISGRAFNVGIPNGNFTVRDLAEAAQRAVPESKLKFTGEHGGDSRTYRVSFNRILTELKDYFSPQWDLDRGAKELISLFKEVNFTEKDFRGRLTNRLPQLKYFMEKNVKKLI